jgi:prepilin-type processing-associated H-X9-DG protein
MMYVQDYDSRYPRSEDGNYVQWYTTVYPYIKSGDQGNPGAYYGRGGVWHCPSYLADDFGEGQEYGVNLGICPLDWPSAWYGGSPQNPTLTVTESQIPSPSDTILAAEKGRNGCANGADNPCYSYPFFIPVEWEWTSVGVGMSNGEPTNDNANYAIAPNVECDTPYSGKDTAWECAMMPRYRHNGTSNMLFADGHAKSITKGSLKWFKNVYVAASYRSAVDNFGWFDPGSPY